jgi:hypothetical protein
LSTFYPSTTIYLQMNHFYFFRSTYLYPFSVHIDLLLIDSSHVNLQLDYTHLIQIDRNAHQGVLTELPLLTKLDWSQLSNINSNVFADHELHVLLYCSSAHVTLR